jgi:hypothetical protein
LVPALVLFLAPARGGATLWNIMGQSIAELQYVSRGSWMTRGPADV